MGSERRKRHGREEARAGAQRLVAAGVWRGGERGGEGMVHVAAAVGVVEGRGNASAGAQHGTSWSGSDMALVSVGPVEDPPSLGLSLLACCM